MLNIYKYDNHINHCYHTAIIIPVFIIIITITHSSFSSSPLYLSPSFSPSPYFFFFVAIILSLFLILLFDTYLYINLPLYQSSSLLLCCLIFFLILLFIHLLTRFNYFMFLFLFNSGDDIDFHYFNCHHHYLHFKHYTCILLVRSDPYFSQTVRNSIQKFQVLFRVIERICFPNIGYFICYINKITNVNCYKL